MSCNSINYGLTGFSLPYIEDLRREAAALPKQNIAANYLNQSNVASSPRYNSATNSPTQNNTTNSPRQNSTTNFPRQNNTTNFPRQNNSTVLPKENKKETFSLTGNPKRIIYACIIAAIILMFIIPISLNISHSNFSFRKPHSNIVQMPTYDPLNDEVNVSESETQDPEDSTAESTIESTVKPATKSPVKLQEELPTQSTVGPPRQSSSTPKAEETKVESVATQKETPVSTPRIISNNFYYIIVGSWPNEIYAKNAQAEFHLKGFRDAGTLYNDNKYRIYINRFDDRGDAEKFLIQFRQDYPMYENAWILMQ